MREVEKRPQERKRRGAVYQEGADIDHIQTALLSNVGQGAHWGWQ